MESAKKETVETAGWTYHGQSAVAVASQGTPFELLADLVSSLQKRAKEGTNVDVAPVYRASGIRVDIIISSRTERVGIVCDHADARKIHHHPSLLNELFVDRLYLTSTLDALIDPAGLAFRIALRERALFDASVGAATTSDRSNLRLSVVGTRQARGGARRRGTEDVRRPAQAESQAA
ncbi:MAG: hypothetical protein R3282_03490 [Rhodothermales bacterium]|nr:hypothetical protein [Rhodothermales bacterium]